MSGAHNAGAAAITSALRGAVQHHQAGRLAEAEQAYRGVVSTDPDNATALHYLGVIASQRGRFDEAVKLISRAVAIQPGAVGPIVNLANALRNLGRNDEAEQRVRHALTLDPDNIEGHISLGITLRQMDRGAEAVEALRRAVALAPGNATAHYNLANALKGEGDNAAAEQAYMRALAIRPNFVFALNNLALVQGELEKFAEAEENYRRSIGHEPRFAETHYNLANLLKTRERFEEACAAYRSAIEINPSHHMAYNNLGFVLQKQKDYDASDDAYRQAIAIRPDFYESRMNLADSLFERLRGAEAIALYEQVIADHPDSSTAKFRLADVLKQSGDTEQSERVYRDILKDDPRSVRAHSWLLEIHRGEADCESAEIVREHFEAPESGVGLRSACGFSLGEYYHSIGRFGEAFDYLRQANALKRASYDYDIQEAVDLTAEIKQVFSADAVAGLAGGGYADAAPIFIIGTTRSGSTLLEQILDCHSQISGAGEARVASELQAQEARRTGERYPLFVRQWRDGDLHSFGQTYMERIRQFSGQAPRVVDKLLQNYVRAGLVKLALPNARIINMRRDPLDVGLSIFMSNFTSLHRHAYSLEEIGTHIRLYDELVRHWQDVFPGEVVDVRYETLVAEPESQVRTILEYCGLEFEPACLEFHRSDRVVRTKSSLQVRQPLNTSGIGRWRNYEAELGPLRQAIGEDLLARWSV